MKYADTAIVFDEVPDEITLAINISECPCNCEGCHSSYLAKDIGVFLDYEMLKFLIEHNSGISCVCFMGGDAEPWQINEFAEWIKKNYPDLKVAWYSGRQEIPEPIDLYNLDYIKVGPYIKEKGPLNSRTTNQRLYKILHIDSEKKEAVALVDLTSEFWKYENSSM